MSGCYKGMQHFFLETNKFAIYVPCAAHSLNLLGRSAVDCCQEAVYLLYSAVFQPQSARGKFLKVVLEMKVS